jgi:aryl-alcohol dehydrogenase-like predicted oxidoreductase
MEKRVLGNSGVEVPVLGFGCGPNAQVMVSDDTAAQEAIVRHAIEAGIDYFDTAAGYGNGRSETNLGRALRALGAHPTISTKVVLEAEDLSDVRGAVLRNFEESLQRLQLGDVDALMLHNRVATSRDYKTTGIGAVLDQNDVYGTNGLLEAFQEIVDSGRVRTVGFTAFGGEPVCIKELIQSQAFGALNASFNAVNPSAGIEVPDDYGDADYENVIAQAREAKMGVMAIRVLSSGTLVRPFEPESREAQITAIAKAHDEGPVSLAIRYVLTKAGVDTAIMGFTEISHIDEAVEAANRGALEDDIVEQIEAIALA